MFQLEDALKIALKYKAILEPYCSKIELAGSIRRQKSYVKDIEIVCIPKTYMAREGLFGVRKRSKDFIEIVNGFTKIIGDPEKGKYCKRELPEGIVLDLFIARQENFGNILAIRTGPASHSKYLMQKGKERGFVFNDGKVIKGSKVIAVPDEVMFYKLIGEEYIQPEFRI